MLCLLTLILNDKYWYYSRLQYILDTRTWSFGSNNRKVFAPEGPEVLPVVDVHVTPLRYVDVTQVVIYGINRDITHKI